MIEKGGARALDDRGFVLTIERWFTSDGARALPWRTSPRDAYAALVSESMLQQTQVSRVIEKFSEFLGRFPDVRSLASAEERDVLSAWSGLGYYRRARNLHGAARMIVSEFDGRVPSAVDDLLRLPGVGRYTAGAIASIAFGKPEPIVDGNVARVLLRVHGRPAATNDRAVQAWLWERAADLVARAKSPGALNEGLMELGATVCLPAPSRPLCENCPLSGKCVSEREGSQMRIPIAKAPPTRRVLWCGALVVVDPEGRVLIEQRGDRGMWAGLTQVPTLERDDRAPTPSELGAAVGLPATSILGTGLFGEPALAFVHQTTHREVRFEVWRANVGGRTRPRRGEFVPIESALAMGISNPTKTILLEVALKVARHSVPRTPRRAVKASTRKLPVRPGPKPPTRSRG